MTTQKNNTCRCGGALHPMDEPQRTLKCSDCEHCSLLVSWAKPPRVIHLADFHLKRGDGRGRPLADLSMASRLVQCLERDVWPSPATITDFGIDSAAHLGALQEAVRCGCTAYDLDRVLGDGPAISELVRCVPEQFYGPVEFKTLFDGMFTALYLDR